MARPWRIEFPGAVYHVMSRGQESVPVFGSGPRGWDFAEEIARLAAEFVMSAEDILSGQCRAHSRAASYYRFVHRYGLAARIAEIFQVSGAAVSLWIKKIS